MKRQQHGFALILVIWALVLLASLATGFAYAIRHETRVATDMQAVARAEAAATAGLHIAVLALSEARWQIDNRAHAIPWPDAEVVVRVQSESGRIDINYAPRDLLVGLFSQLYPDMDPERLADALIDWRDRDDKPGLSGAESEAYIQAGYAYVPSNTAFYSVNELSQVMGFDNAMLERAMPYLTVYSRQPRVHALSADLVVLTAVPGIARPNAQAFVAQRSEAVAEDGAIDYTPLDGGRKYLDTRTGGRMFSLDIEVRLAGGFVRHEHAVVQLGRRTAFTLLARETLPIAVPADAGAP